MVDQIVPANDLAVCTPQDNQHLHGSGLDDFALIAAPDVTRGGKNFSSSEFEARFMCEVDPAAE
ncbi:hypothetical protein GCM10023264_11110 [Sphingomonas daechungensis]